MKNKTCEWCSETATHRITIEDLAKSERTQSLVCYRHAREDCQDQLQAHEL